MFVVRTPDSSTLKVAIPKTTAEAMATNIFIQEKSKKLAERAAERAAAAATAGAASRTAGRRAAWGSWKPRAAPKPPAAPARQAVAWAEQTPGGAPSVMTVTPSAR